MSAKTKLARKAVKTTAKHTAHGAASKITRQPMRTTTLLALGAAVGALVGWMIGRSGSSRPEPVAPAPPRPGVATNGTTADKTSEPGVVS